LISAIDREQRLDDPVVQLLADALSVFHQGQALELSAQGTLTLQPCSQGRPVPSREPADNSHQEHSRDIGGSVMPIDGGDAEQQDLEQDADDRDLDGCSK
jgi:hypothetical protein